MFCAAPSQAVARGRQGWKKSVPFSQKLQRFSPVSRYQNQKAFWAFGRQRAAGVFFLVPYSALPAQNPGCLRHKKHNAEHPNLNFIIPPLSNWFNLFSRRILTMRRKRTIFIIKTGPKFSRTFSQSLSSLIKRGHLSVTENSMTALAYYKQLQSKIPSSSDCLHLIMRGSLFININSL